MRMHDDPSDVQGGSRRDGRANLDAGAMKGLFAEVQQESTRTKVYLAVRNAIISGRLRTGQKLTEVGLATTFKVSRSVIREALRELVRDGLVEQNAYKSTRVVRLTPEQVDEVLSVRLVLELEAVRLVHGRLSDADRQELRALAAQLESTRGDEQRHAALDLALHDRLWQLSGNRTLETLLRQITAPLFAMGVIMRSSGVIRRLGRDPVSPADHRVLIEAICGGSREEAVEALRVHITYNWQRVKEHLETFEEVQVTTRPAASSSKRSRPRK